MEVFINKLWLSAPERPQFPNVKSLGHFVPCLALGCGERAKLRTAGNAGREPQ
jgi:hypothetical protein